MKGYGYKLGILTAAALVAALPERKITKDFLESEIDQVDYDRLKGTLTHCTIITKSGYQFTGESACVDPNNFDEEIGKQVAYNNAFEKMWMPYGFWLHKALAEFDSLPTNTAQEDWLKEDMPVEGGSVQDWYQQQYSKITNEAGVSEDVIADEVLEELTGGIEYVAKCAIREDLINLLDDNVEAIEVVKEYFKDLVIVE